MLDSWSMKKFLAIVALSLLWSKSVYALENYYKLENCESPYSSLGVVLEVDLIKKVVKFSGGKGPYSGSYKVNKISGVYVETKETQHKGDIFRINLKYGEIQLKRPWLTSSTFKNTCRIINGELTEYGKAREKTKAIAKKPENKEKEKPKKKEPPKKEITKAPETVKKPKKKEPPKKQITKAPEIDGSLLTIGSGSGFYINNKGYALTNNHVVEICKQMVAVVDGREILLRVLNTDKINDVAVLKTDYKSRSYIKINEDGAKLGENVIAVGYPLAGRLSDSVKITRGIVSSLSGLDNNIGQIQIDAALQPGNSGGPVLNEKGELIGIASAGLNKLLMAKEAKYIPENVNFAVASPIVVNILKSKKIKYTTPNMFSGSYSNTELAELGDKSTIQLFCRNTRTAYNRLKSSNKYSTILLDLD